MSKEEARIRMLTVEEANALLPQLRLTLKELRGIRAEGLKTQAQVEIEELTGQDGRGKLSPAAHQAIQGLMEKLHEQANRFETKMAETQRMGAHLKDLDKGLVDFYSLRDEDVVLLCWLEEEPSIRYWHSLEGGFRGRQPLD